MFRSCAVFSAILSAVGFASAADPKPIDFVKDIKPILDAHCTDCHGLDEQESGLRLDAGTLLRRGGDRGPIVVPGKSADSLLIKVLMGKGDVEAMPQGQDRLSDKQIAMIGLWIDQGAKIPKNEKFVETRVESNHWAFQPIVRHALPAVKDSAWLRNGIDNFVQAKLEKLGVAHSPQADRVTMIRRLHFDLLGMPPAPADVDAFLADKFPGSYNRLVDRILASPRYGERWGRHWLDLARYADSNGFTIDGARTIWPYRDWVVQALNDDMPFDQFSTEQLAGDLLPKATRSQLVATGFHRNTLINQEGGTNDEQFRVESVVDRVNTTGAVFLGLTIGCAQCHKHKYDPITQRDFYKVYAIFNNTEDNNDARHASGALGPLVSLPTDEQATRKKQLDAEYAVANKKLQAHDAEFAKGQPAWEKSLAVANAKSVWTPRKPVLLKSANGATLEQRDDLSVLSGNPVPDDDVYTVEIDIPDKEITAIKLETLTHASLPKMGPGRTPHGNFTLNEFEAYATPLSETGAVQDAKSFRIKFLKAIADHQQKGGPVSAAIDGKPDTFWGVYGPPEIMNSDHEAAFILDKPYRSQSGTRLRIVMRQKYKSPKYIIGRFRLSTTSVSPDVLGLPDKTRKLLATPVEKRTVEQKKQLAAIYRETDKSRKPLADATAAIKRKLDAVNSTIPTTMIMREMPKPRTTHIQIRGDFLRLGAVVNPGTPAVLPPIAVEQPSRLDLSNWLFDPSNPLTARVTVNRIWQRFFGLGIVETENDFGTQGTLPDHPELLDWLSSEFIRQEWGLKAMHRLIVTSATYRQSSHMREDLLAEDPQNRLLARQSRIRLEAEAIRDTCLQASGLLSDKMKGPGVYPPAPKSNIDLLTQNRKNWAGNEDKAEDRFRRGVYTYFWRSAPYPFLPTFDAPDANTACTRRPRSNTPLQALTLANDRSFIEFAQGMAVRILTEAPNYDEGRIRHVFKICVSRDPSDYELGRVSEFLGKQRAFYKANPEKANQIAPMNSPKRLKPAESATWTVVARALMNLDEFITRE